LFLKALAAEATLEAQSSKQRSIQETHVTAVAQVPTDSSSDARALPQLTLFVNIAGGANPWS
jgi:hypothetical protein